MQTLSRWHSSGASSVTAEHTPSESVETGLPRPTDWACFHRKRLLAVSVCMPRRVETACWVQPEGKRVAHHLLCISPLQSIWFLQLWRGWDITASFAITEGAVMEVKVRMCWSKDPACLVDGLQLLCLGHQGHWEKHMLAVGSGRRKLTVVSERKGSDSPVLNLHWKILPCKICGLYCAPEGHRYTSCSKPMNFSRWLPH